MVASHGRSRPEIYTGRNTMSTLRIGSVGLGGIGSTGFRVSTQVYDEDTGRPDTVLRFQGAKRVNACRVEDRSFGAGVSVHQLIGLLIKFADLPHGSRRLVGDLPELQALLDSVKAAEAEIQAENLRLLEMRSATS